MGLLLQDAVGRLSLRFKQIDGITQRNSLTGNETDWVDLGRVNVVDDVTLKDLGLPYVVSDLKVSAGGFLGILAGVEVEFRAGAVFEVVGSLSTYGEPDRRVPFYRN